VQRGIERTLLDLERVVAELLQALDDAVTVHRAARKRLEHEHVERALQELGFLRGHCEPPVRSPDEVSFARFP
jgi:hypothetical protein